MLFSDCQMKTWMRSKVFNSWVSFEKSFLNKPVVLLSVVYIWGTEWAQDLQMPPRFGVWPTDITVTGFKLNAYESVCGYKSFGKVVYECAFAYIACSG